jgi:hypothetical protein
MIPVRDLRNACDRVGDSFSGHLSLTILSILHKESAKDLSTVYAQDILGENFCRFSPERKSMRRVEIKHDGRFFAL